MNKHVKRYYRVMLGRQSTHAAECLAGGFIGADFGIEKDLSGKLLAVPSISFYRYQVSFKLIKH